MNHARWALSVLVLLIVTASLVLSHTRTEEQGSPETASRRGRASWACTFSIVAFDADRSVWGVAVASKYLAVGSVVPWAKAGVGAVATQSFVNVTYGPDGLDLLAQGKSADEAVKILTEADSGKERRQVGVVDANDSSS